MCVNALGFQGSIRLPSGPKLREGQLDGYILTCTQAVKSAVCLCMCVCVVCVCVYVLKMEMLTGADEI